MDIVRKLPPISLREFRLKYKGVAPKEPEEYITYNRDVDADEKTEPREVWKWLDETFGTPSKYLLHEPLEHFLGVYPTASLSLSSRGAKQAALLQKVVGDMFLLYKYGVLDYVSPIVMIDNNEYHLSNIPFSKLKKVADIVSETKKEFFESELKKKKKPIKHQKEVLDTDNPSDTSEGPVGRAYRWFYDPEHPGEKGQEFFTETVVPYLGDPMYSLQGMGVIGL